MSRVPGLRRVVPDSDTNPTPAGAPVASGTPISVA